MQKKFSDYKGVFVKRKRLTEKWWLFAIPLIGVVLIYVWLNFESQARNAQAYRKLTTNSYSGDVVVFSPDGKTLDSAHKSNPATLKLWDLETDKLLYTVETNHNGGTGLLTFSPDSRTIASSDSHDGNQLFLRDARTGNKKDSLIGAQWSTSSLFFSSDGTFLVNAGRNRSATVEIRDVSTGRLLHTLVESTTGTAFAFPMPDNKTALIVSKSGVKLRDLRSSKLLRFFSLGDSNNTKEHLEAALSSDGRTLAAGVQREVQLWNMDALLKRGTP